MSKEDQLDVDLNNKVDQILRDRIATELINGITLPKAIEICNQYCVVKAERIIKEAEGEVLENIKQTREAIINELAKEREEAIGMTD